MTQLQNNTNQTTGSPLSKGYKDIPKYVFIDDPEYQRDEFVDCLELLQASPVIAIDTETTGLSCIDNRVRLIQIACKDIVLIVDLNSWRGMSERTLNYTKELKQLVNIIQSNKPVIMQNAAFDINFLKGEGIVVNGPIFDTMIANKIINNGTGAKNDLGTISARWLNEPMDKTLQKSDWSGVIDTNQLEYGAKDASALLYLQPILSNELQAARVNSRTTLFDVFKLEMQVVRAVASMTFNGFSFDKARALELKAKLEDEEGDMKHEFLEELDATIADEHPDKPELRLPRNPDGSYNTREKDTGSVKLGTKKLKGFNPRSPQQLADKLQAAGIMLPVKPNDPEQKPSLDQTLLAFLRADYFLINQYLEWKAVVTRISAVEKLLNSISPNTGKIHASYRQVGTDTGRLSCAEPNLQQVPRTADFRSLFTASPGCKLVVGDFSQIELRVAAELSEEPRMIEAYQAGRDLHTETAALMLGIELEEVSKAQRQSAKIANFGLLFGAGAATLRKQAIAQYGLALSLSEARKIVSGFRMAYPKLYDWQTIVGNRDTAAVLTLYGRRRILVGFNDRYTVRINTEVQGTAGDIGKIAMAMLYKEITARGSKFKDVRIIAMVHDEIVLECPEHLVSECELMLKQNMENAGRVLCVRVPIVAEVSSGYRWSEAK